MIAYRQRRPEVLNEKLSWSELPADAVSATLIPGRTPEETVLCGDLNRNALWKGSGKNPPVVCLLGSTRFYTQFQRANYEETRAGRIVLSIGFFPESDHHGPEVGITPEEKLRADVLHKTKIRMAWECIALNQNHYIGASTRSEVRYALLRGKPVRFLLPPTPAELERLNVHLVEIR